MPVRYIWSHEKGIENIRKHGIPFGRAVRIFERTIVERVDDRHDYGETRIQAIGLVEEQEIFVVYVDVDDDTRRIISARKAERHEREAYWREVARAQR